MIDHILTEEVTERAVLVGLISNQQNEAKAREYLDELAFLADTAGAVTVKTFLQKLEYPNPRTYVGKGKLEEIRAYIEDNDIGMAIFDDDLSSKQVVNIERELKVKILDRTSLILDIFAKRARTANAKTQVELAQYQYLLPRLTRMWTHLERQRGGIGMRGPGETQIETDRRIILSKISLLKEELRRGGSLIRRARSRRLTCVKCKTACSVWNRRFLTARRKKRIWRRSWLLRSWPAIISRPRRCIISCKRCSSSWITPWLNGKMWR